MLPGDVIRNSVVAVEFSVAERSSIGTVDNFILDIREDSHSQTFFSQLHPRERGPAMGEHDFATSHWTYFP